MSTAIPHVIELLVNLKQIITRIPADFGGGSPLSKIFLMVHLALEYGLRNYVEIGAYEGRSFFSMAYVAKRLNGMAYAIDADDYEVAREHDLEEETSRQGDDLLASLDFSQIDEDVKALRRELALTEHSEIIRAAPATAIDYFREKNIAIDMLHIDGNHDKNQVFRDVALYLPLIREGCFLVIDDINWESVKPVYDQLKKQHEVVFDNGLFAILSTSDRRTTLLQKHRLNILYSLVENAATPREEGTLTVSVALTTYNQERYIAECLDGIFAQRGNFVIEVVIGDDHSTDSTLEIIRHYTAVLGGHRFRVNILPTASNLGMTKNLQRTLAACTGDYIAICEGDDYWTDPHKLQKQLDFLSSHPNCALCFHDFYMYFQESGECIPFDLQQSLKVDIITTRELILNNSIGNFSCCMYDARFMKEVPSSLFDMFIADWMFNIYYSRFGEIGHLREILSAYRKHTEGVWTGRTSQPAEPRDVYLHALIEEYNQFLDYEFDAEFCAVQRRIELTYPDRFHHEELDLAIIDDSFPHPLSAFRVQEFTSYLNEFDRLKIYCSGEALPWLGAKTLDELFRDFKRAFPGFARKIERWVPRTRVSAKLFYFVFLGNAHRNLEWVEQLGIPFVFTLYPGSVFGINNEKSDRMLKELTASPCFQKVIVTQKITYDYLIEKKFCKPHQIEFIFGVVTPLEQIANDYAKEKLFGIDKSTLDICFVAHKYELRGIDKGYDIFVDVARQLCKRYDNIQFHVVGGFDRDVMDVSDLSDKITFYGRREMEWFDQFYKNQDIILSPNVPFMNPQVQGSFDGFPTAACVDAGLRKTAIFCTDELHLNTQFVDREEIVIVPHDASQVVGILEYYYQHPQEIKRIAEKGSRRIKQLYGQEAQILPRIRILTEEVRRAESSKQTILQAMKTHRVKLSRTDWLNHVAFWLIAATKRKTPAWVLDLILRGIHKVRSHETLFGSIKRMMPSFLLRLIAKLRDSD